MPSVSPKQAHFMSAVAHSAEFAAKAGVPQSVGREFHEADKRQGTQHSDARKKVIEALTRK